MNDVEKIMRQVRAHELAHDEELKRLRTLTMEERAEMISAACETVASVYASRIAAGLPPARPVPWPASTFEFLTREPRRGNGDESGA